MSARAAQITVLSLIVLFAIVVLGFNSYITWAFYGYVYWDGGSSLDGDSLGGTSGSSPGYKTYLTSGYAYRYATFTTTKTLESMYQTYSWDIWTRLNGQVTSLSYLKHDYKTYTTRYLTSDYGYHSGVFTTYGYIYRRDGNGGGAGGNIATATAKVSEKTQALPAVTAEATRPTAPPAKPTVPPTAPTAPTRRDETRIQKRNVQLEKRGLEEKGNVQLEKRGNEENYNRVEQKERVTRRRDQKQAARSLRRAAELEKRRRGGSSSSSSSSGESMSMAARYAPFPVLIAFASLTVIWAMVQLIVSGTKPNAKFASVGWELTIVGILIAMGLGSTIAGSVLWGDWLGGIIPLVAMVVDWILVALLMAYALFLWIHTNRFYNGKEGRKRSLAALVKESRQAKLQQQYGGAPMMPGMQVPPGMIMAPAASPGMVPTSPGMVPAAAPGIITDAAPPPGLPPGGYYVPGPVPPGSPPGTAPPMYYIPPTTQPFMQQQNSGTTSDSTLAFHQPQFSSPSFGPSTATTPGSPSLAPSVAPLISHNSWSATPSQTPPPGNHGQSPYDVVHHGAASPQPDAHANVQAIPQGTAHEYYNQRP